MNLIYIVLRTENTERDGKGDVGGEGDEGTYRYILMKEQSEGHSNCDRLGTKQRDGKLKLGRRKKGRHYKTKDETTGEQAGVSPESSESMAAHRHNRLIANMGSSALFPQFAEVHVMLVIFRS